MAVFRVERTRNYTVMSNHHLRDKSLSLKAKGLLSQMLSLPEDWDYTLAGLARINCEGRDAIRAAVYELEEAGYVTRSRTRDGKGRLLGAEYVIREEPVFSAEPALEEPAPGNPTLEKTPQLNKDTKQKKNLRSKDSIPFPSAPSGVPAQARRSGLRGERRRSGMSELSAQAGSGGYAPCTDEAAAPQEAKGRKRSRRSAVRQEDMDDYRALIRENIAYDRFVRDHPYDAPQLDELVELMVEAVCSKRSTLRVAGSDFPQAVVKSRLLKLERAHIQFVLDCLRENTTRVKNIKQYLLTVLYNAPVTMENHYAARVNHDLYTPEGTP